MIIIEGPGVDGKLELSKISIMCSGDDQYKVTLYNPSGAEVESIVAASILDAGTIAGDMAEVIKREYTKRDSLIN